MQPPATDAASDPLPVAPRLPVREEPAGASRRELMVAALAIALVTAAVFGPSLLDPHASGKYDVFRAFGPWSYFFDRSVQSGDFPEWNPLTLGGAPFAANPQSWALYPPNILRALLLVHPTPMGTLAGLAVLALLHVCVLGIGTYRLARAHDLSRSAAALAMLGASLNALVVRRVAELHFIFTLAWLPFILLHARAFVRAETHRERLHEGTWLACYAALALLGGFPQLYPYIAAGVLAYVVVERFADPRLLGAAVLPQTRARAFGKLLLQDLAYAVPAVLLLLALGACLLLPAAEFAGLSARVASAKATADGHLPAEWTLSYAWRSVVVYAGREYEPETLRGAGIGVLALASAGMLAGVTRRSASLLAAFYVFIDLLIGPPMPIATAVALVSPFQMVSVTRAADVGLVFFALLAGCGLDAIRSTALWRRALATVAALAVGGAAVYTLHGELEQGRIWVAQNSAMLLVPAALLVGLVVAGALAARGPLALARAVPFVIVALVACELLAWNGPYARALIVNRSFRNWLSTTDLLGANPFWPDNRREADERPNFGLFTLRGQINGYDPLHLDGVRRFIASRGRSKRYERTVTADETLARNARGHLFMKRAFWLVPAVVVGKQPPHTTLYPPTEVAFVAERPGRLPVRERNDVLGRGVLRDATRIDIELPKLRTTGKREGKQHGRAKTGWVDVPAQHAVLELRLRARGRVAVAPRVERERGDPSLPREMFALAQQVTSEELTEHRIEIPLPDLRRLRVELDLQWDSGNPAPELLSLAVLSDPSDEDAKIEVMHRTADEVRVRVSDLPAARLLVLSDADYPGWHVEVDGKPAKLVRAAAVFKGVELLGGSHDVRFYFRSSRLRFGLWIGAVALAISAVLLWVTRRPRRAPG